MITIKERKRQLHRKRLTGHRTTSCSSRTKSSFKREREHYL